MLLASCEQPTEQLSIFHLFSFVLSVVPWLGPIHTNCCSWPLRIILASLDHLFDHVWQMQDSELVTLSSVMTLKWNRYRIFSWGCWTTTLVKYIFMHETIWVPTFRRNWSYLKLMRLSSTNVTYMKTVYCDALLQVFFSRTIMLASKRGSETSLRWLWVQISTWLDCFTKPYCGLHYEVSQISRLLP